MERIKQMNLKKALFTIAFINITIALILSFLSVWGCVIVRSQLAPNGVVIDVHTTPVLVTQMPEPTEQAATIAEIISIVQIILPILIYIFALLITVSMFYHLKLKEPLAVLTKGASLIIENDLDFTIEAKSQDELGKLCTAFETMRKTLLDNNRELWAASRGTEKGQTLLSH